MPILPRALLLLAVIVPWGPGAALAARAPPHAYTDESTGATILVADRPIVFARSRRDVAANARDYVTLAAAAVDRSGDVRYFIVAYRWSTVDARLDPERGRNESRLVIAADDRRIELDEPVPSARDVGIARPVLPPPGPPRAPLVYPIDLATLRYLAAARRLSLRLGAGELAPTYDIWDDGRRALRAFVESASPAR